MAFANAISMGTRLNSWEELLDNHSHVANDLQSAFVSRLHERNIPNVIHEDGSVGLSLGENRSYYFSSHSRGAYLTVAIREFGKDLYIGWTLWWKARIKWHIIIAILVLSLIVGVISGMGASRLFGPSAMILSAIVPIIITSISLFTIIGFAGSVLRGSFTAFFMTELDLFTIEDMTALTFAVDHSLRQSADKIGLAVKFRERTEFYCGKKPGQRLF